MAARVARVQPERLDEIRGEVRDASLLPFAESGMLNASLHRPLAEVRDLPGLKRIVYTSSVTTIGHPRGAEPGLPAARLAREIDRYGFGRDPSPYFLAKRLLESMVTRAANEGLPAVVTNPTLVVGPGDAHMTTGRLVVSVMKGEMPFYLPGRLNAIAAEDVGEGHVLAATRGRTAQRYILGNETFAVRDFLKLIAEEAGVARPWIPIPFAIAEPISLVTELIAWGTGARWALFPTHSLRMIRFTPQVDSALAIRELGLPQTPVREAVRRAVEWYRKEGLA
jgi:dihydroflavonol-4-reductase